MVSGAKKWIIWLLWLVIFPLGLWFTFQTYPPYISGQEIDVFIYLLLAIVVAATPMVINGSPVFLIQWISWAAFLTFGLFVELVMAQIALIVLFIRVKLPRNAFFRLPLNSLMFFLVSLLSGVFYYSLGGNTGVSLSEVKMTFWLVVTYPVLYYFLNHFIIIIINFAVYNNKKKIFGKDFIWETVTTLITFPIGFVLYILYTEVGLIALLFVGVPFASLSIILNLYYSSDKINTYLQKATEIGHQLAEKLVVNEVINLFIEKITKMLTVDYAYILDVVDENELQLLRCIENGKEKSANIRPLKKNEGISGLVWDKGEAMLFHTKKEWKHIVKGYMPETVESVICVPIVRNNKVMGVLLLASTQKRAYEKSQLMIVDILCSHFAVAIENARHYEETKAQSERCALTKLYNYRYFENLLTKEFDRLETFEREQLSLLILDVDHFKKINDTYGHQSGNEILCQLANELQKLIGVRGTVARYGGEEFVILLPDVTKEEALIAAETIRQTIALHTFILTQHMERDRTPLGVNITASIGVAAAPSDAEDSLGLIRHADRALYVGAKRAGRNRVAEYVR
ncbi:sensor domain-containing diguanylate cyclase [Cytobacillus massiliigabonensis]|uniref:sensor domain-containing diguanylate cyclase n=1 Tax=Cytobacillus massiliigabonensis TaxID=1871011 RepID=UPI000C822808|nr:sensor domain-containing diguanylate cyclase [Cytobacillus massiliigabonensis]